MSKPTYFTSKAPVVAFYDNGRAHLSYRPKRPEEDKLRVSIIPVDRTSPAIVELDQDIFDGTPSGVLLESPKTPTVSFPRLEATRVKAPSEASSLAILPPEAITDENAEIEAVVEADELPLLGDDNERTGPEAPHRRGLLRLLFRLCCLRC